MASTISAGLTTTTALVYSADTSGVLQLQTNGTTTAVTIDTSQRVGIGTTSPSYLLQASLPSSTSGVVARFSAPSYENFDIYVGSTKVSIGSASGATPLGFNISGLEVGRFDGSGNYLVGVTSQFSSGKLCVQVANGSTTNGISIQDNGSSGFGYIAFANGSGSTIGSIARVTTTNAVVYNTTSDYRLKNVVGSVTGQGERIDALKPIDYTWKDGGQNARGFLAHEFQAVYADSVTGEKDAVDADGNPVYQGMQASTPELIADLVAEIQSLRARLKAANIA